MTLRPCDRGVCVSVPYHDRSVPVSVRQTVHGRGLGTVAVPHVCYWLLRNRSFSFTKYYKKHKPSSADEFEYMENLFDCLCSCLMIATNRELFLKGEGLQLMRLILR